MNRPDPQWDPVETACVILTERFEGLDKTESIINSIPVSTVNKPYKALTRSKGGQYLIKTSILEKNERYRINADGY